MPAGHDRFDGGLIEEHLGPAARRLGISFQQLMGLGRVEPQNEGETFCMTVLGLKLSRRANAVSACTAMSRGGCGPTCGRGASKKKFPSATSPTASTCASWLAWQMQQLYDRKFPVNWFSRMGEPEVWQDIHNVDPGELWEMHHTLKNLLLAFVRRRVSRQCRRRGESDESVEAARNMLDPNVLTIGFARRFATYKRADLMMTDIDRFSDMLNDPERPIQIIFAGKAHPADEPGKQLIKRIANLRHDERFASRVAFIEDYDINVCRHLVQGVDVWLNNPRRPLEASGTSGQKAVLNGGAEPVGARRLVGRGLRRLERLRHRQGNQPRLGRDQRPARRRRPVPRAEEAVIPLYYDRDVDGLPRHVDPADDELDRLAGLAVQRPPHGDGLRPPLVPARRRRRELRNERALRAVGGRW